MLAMQEGTMIGKTHLVLLFLSSTIMVNVVQKDCCTLAHAS
jgi:hypothetical protein